MDHILIDDFLPLDTFEQLKADIIFNSSFPLYLATNVAKPPIDSETASLVGNFLKNRSLSNQLKNREDGSWNWYGSHIMYADNKPQSPYYTNVYEEIFSPKLNVLDNVVYVGTGNTFLRSLIRLKVNFYPYTKEVKEHAPHIDYKFKHIGAVFSLNTCDGFTRLKDGTKIMSKENRIVFFDASEEHNSSTTSDAKGRYNINFNLI